MDINSYVSGVTANISNQTSAKSIGASVVGQAYIDLANLTKTNVEAVNATSTGNTVSIANLSGTTSGLTNSVATLSGTTSGLTNTLGTLTSRIVTTDNGFSVSDVNGNLLFNVDLASGINAFLMSIFGDNGELYFSDKLGNIAARIGKSGSLHLGRNLYFHTNDGIFSIGDANNNMAFQIDKKGLTSFSMSPATFAQNFAASKSLLDLTVPVSDYTLYAPPHLFGVESGSGERREYFTNLYCESLTSIQAPWLINGARKATVQNLRDNSIVTASTLSEIHTFSLAATGYSAKTFSTTYYKANRKNAQSKLINIHCIGDSILNENTPFFDGTIGGWANFVQQFLIMDNIDISGITANFVGTVNPYSNNVTYSGQTVAAKTFSEGRPGWCTYGYLNFPKWARLDGGNTAGAGLDFLGAEGMYYALGLISETPFDTTTPGHADILYSANDANYLRICTTPFGRFKPNYNAYLWTALINRWGMPQSGGYISGGTSDAIMENFLFGSGGIANPNGGVIAVPDNPYYNIAKGRAYTGSYVWTNTNAFDFSNYLSKYRTQDDNGNRLYFNASSGTTGTASTGNTGYLANGTATAFKIGSQVTNTLAYNVCTPTHVVSGLGTNDFTMGVNNFTAIGMDLLSQFTNLGSKVGWFRPRRPGVLYPDKWNELGVMKPIVINPDDYTMVKNYEAAIGSLNSAHTLNYIPAYYTMSPVSAGYVDRYGYDLDELNGVKKVISGIDNLHLSAYSLRSIAYQIYGWLNWTFS